MNDTSEDVEKQLFDKMMRLSGEERMKLGAESYESARAMIRASLPAGLTAAEIHAEVFKRMYADDFSDEQLNIRAAYLKENFRAQ